MSSTHERLWSILAAVAIAACQTAVGWDAAGQLDEFKIKREPVFEFVQKPVVTRQGDNVTIAFESKGLCDVTVAVEDAAGRIIRHLASGVLGPNAPLPLQKDSKKQAVIWDGKDDQGVYVDDKDRLVVRVSLGLKPQFERTLFWSPKKRIAPGHRPLFASGPEGVFVHEGGGVDHIRQFDHAGNYVRTVYPFPPDYTSPEAKSDAPKALQAALAKVVGLKWIEFPQDGKWFPEWQGIMFSSLLTSGDNAGTGTARVNPTKYGSAASAMALIPSTGAGRPGRLALVKKSLNRVATDGTTDGLPLDGPKTMVEVANPGGFPNPLPVYPMSAAVSPDGQWIYLTGYQGPGQNFIPAVTRMRYEGDKPPELFVGNMENNHGKGDNQFCCPLWVTCDSQGRVYVADYDNDRIQVFTPDGKLYKSVPTTKPLRVFVHPKSGHIYVASWLYVTRHLPGDIRLKASYTHLGPVDDPKPVATYPLTLAAYSEAIFMNRTYPSHDLFVDFQTEPPTVWLVPGTGDSTEKLMQQRRDFSKGQWSFSGWSESHFRLLIEKDGKLVEKANFAKDVGEAITRISPPGCPAHGRQRLYVNPKDGMLYVMEGDGGVGKSTRELLRIDPNTGKVTTLRLPFSAEEIAFDLNGLAYLRTDVAVGRYDSANWREVPWDYGEEMVNPGFDGDGGKVISFLAMPGSGKPGQFHLGGFGVSPKGSIVVSCYNIQQARSRTQDGPDIPDAAGRPYMPAMFPGRVRYAEVHIWDNHGQLQVEDAAPGLGLTDGLAIDRDDNIYAVAAGRRQLNGADGLKMVVCSETLMKLKPKKAKVLSRDKGLAVPLSPEAAPKRPPDIDMAFGGATWVEDAEWLYGGVGRDGFIPHWAPNCSCWNSRAALDLFARSFATELGRSSVAVLDTNGNLILRIGKYGNVDDGVPLMKNGGPANPRSIGSDEVALAAPAYVATHTDRSLYIADYGNYRILRVKLGYHAEEKTGLQGVPDPK
jgi:hypothetical protein